MAKVVALQKRDATPGHALVAIVGRTRKSTELVTVTLELVECDGV